MYLKKKLLDLFFDKILYPLLDGILNNKLLSLCVVMFATIMILLFQIANYKSYPTSRWQAKNQNILQQVQELSNSCNTQNFFGVMTRQGSKARFLKIYGRSKTNMPVVELTQQGTVFTNQYHYNKIHNVGFNENDIQNLIQKKLWKHKTFLGVKPIPIINKNGLCKEWTMKLILKPTQTQFGNDVKFYEDGFVQMNYNIPFLTKTIFPNLNAKCNQAQYDKLYEPTNLKEIWLYNADVYILWISLAELDKCKNANGRQSVQNAIADIGNQFLDNYEKIDMHDLIPKV